MRCVWAMAFLLAFATAAAAQGCGPTRLKVMESVALDTPPASAWRLIGNFQDMSWAKGTRAIHGIGGNQPEHALRSVTLTDGAVLGESLYKYDDRAMSYAYHIDTLDVAVLPIQNASVTLEVVGTDGGSKSIVRWHAAFYRYIKPGEVSPDSADAAATKAVEALGHAMLAGLKAKAEAKT